MKFLPLAAAALALSVIVAHAAPSVPALARLGESKASDSRLAGELLLSELSCFACHEGAAATDWKSGPKLDAVGSRVQPSYLRSFLSEPGKTRPGTTMPDVLAALPAEQREGVLDDLVHFLASRDETPATPMSGSAEAGAKLFETIGCVACHAAKPLGDLSAKYASGQLAAFLLDPLKVRPSGRMPSLHLTPQEAADIAAHLAPNAQPRETFSLDETKAQRGRAAFAQLGCAACHEAAEKRGPSFVASDPDRGCLSSATSSRAPRYDLDDAQRSALRSAITARQIGGAAGSNEADRVKLTMLQRNCVACHSRDGFGGPTSETAPHFTSTKDDLGDLGRLPPPLDHVGRKLLPDALANILRGRDRVRGYMRTRMPDFGAENAQNLSRDLIAADRDPDEKPSIATENPNQVGRNEWGRAMVGTTGYGCIACHDLHEHPSLGIGAYDLMHVPKRLRPEWIRDFLLNPAAFPTGARMPAFWPGGKPMNPKLGGGSAERQIDSIRVYLTEVDQSLPPEGFVDPAAFELKPAERPIVFRTFIAGAGTHAIGVGFPGGLNAAFDAAESRWALAWRGRFLDADGTWNQRAAKMETPLGDGVVSLRELGEVTAGKEQARKYLGYRIDASGAPTFLYAIGDLRIEDSIVPTKSQPIRRVVRVSGVASESVHWKSAASGEITARIVSGVSATGEIALQNGRAEIVEEISW